MFQVRKVAWSSASDGCDLEVVGGALLQVPDVSSNRGPIHEGLVPRRVHRIFRNLIAILEDDHVLDNAAVGMRRRLPVDYDCCIVFQGELKIARFTRDTFVGPATNLIAGWAAMVADLCFDLELVAHELFQATNAHSSCGSRPTTLKG